VPDGHARLRMCLEHEYDVRVRDLTPFFEMPDRAVYRADTDRPGLVVRVFPPTRSSERVACDAAVLQYAAAAGIPAEPLASGPGPPPGRVRGRPDEESPCQPPGPLRDQLGTGGTILHGWPLPRTDANPGTRRLK
jgi:hypothetical protein